MPGGEKIYSRGVVAVDKEKPMAAFDGRASLGRDGEADRSSEGLTAETWLPEHGTGSLEAIGCSDADLDLAKIVAVQNALAPGSHGSTVVHQKVPGSTAIQTTTGAGDLSSV